MAAARRLPQMPPSVAQTLVSGLVAGEGAELVEHQPALALAGAHVPSRHLLGDRLPLAHR